MKTTTPRWLRLTMLPPLAAALFVVDTEVQTAIWRVTSTSGTAAIEVFGYLLATFVGPLITALLFAYPIARLYARHSVAASALLCVPIFLFKIFGIDGDLVSLLTFEVASLGILLAATAWLANRELADSRLVIADCEALQPDSGIASDRNVGSVAPRWLTLALLPILAIGFYLLDDQVQPLLEDIAFKFHPRAIMLTGLLSGAVIGPAVLAMLFAYPLARLYGRRAAVVAVLISAYTILIRVFGYLADVHLPFVVAAYIIQPVSLGILVPLAASRASRRLGSSRLAIVSREHSGKNEGDESPMGEAQPEALLST